MVTANKSVTSSNTRTFFDMQKVDNILTKVPTGKVLRSKLTFS